jgi:hypothetical protein
MDAAQPSTIDPPGDGVRPEPGRTKLIDCEDAVLPPRPLDQGGLGLSGDYVQSGASPSADSHVRARDEP